jgi:hypothetical protein
MKKQCKRRIWSLVNPITYAMQGAAITPQQELNKLRNRELMAIEAFVKGTATLREWHDMTAMLNLAETMARDGIGPEVLPVCEEAQEHLTQAARRFERVKKMGTTGLGIQCFRDLYEYHDLQRSSISRGELEKLITKTLKRIKSKAPEVVEL